MESMIVKSGKAQSFVRGDFYLPAFKAPTFSFSLEK
jgi:hypothetical protein